MNSHRRTAIVAELAIQLERRGSWCGETHLQKATYFLQELAGVRLGFEFTLYKHGPYSFDLRDHLTAMRADGFLIVQTRPHPYGPSLVPTDRSRSLVLKSRTVARYRPSIEFVAAHLGSKKVSELERLATALFVARETPQVTSVEARAQLINQLKPHVSVPEAVSAVEQVDVLAAQVGGLTAAGR